jgi:hypothetical protein
MRTESGLAAAHRILIMSFGMMVAGDGVEWNYVRLDGLTLYPKQPQVNAA